MLRTLEVILKNFALCQAGLSLALLSIVATTVVTENVALAETDHGTRGLRTSRPLAAPSGSARLNQILSSCLAGRPAVGNPPIDNTAVGAFDPGAVVDPGIGGDDVSVPIGGNDALPPGSTLAENDGGNVDGEDVFRQNCATCHSSKDDAKFKGIAKITLAITSRGGQVGGPPAMKANLAKLSTDEQTALLQFLGQ